MVRQSVHFLFVILLACVTVACHRKSSFIVDGKVLDGGNGMIYIFKYGNKNFHLVDSIPYTDGLFTYIGETNQPLLYGISVNSQDDDPQSFFIGEDTLKIAFWKTGKEIIAYNSPLNDAYLSMREKASAATVQAILRYVHDYSSSPVTAYFVLHDWSWRLDISTLRLIYDTLEPSLENCIYLRRLDDLLKNMENVQPGKSMPSTSDVSKVEQQTVLVFFASWCPDCQSELPFIERAVRIHKDIRFIGFSLDVNKTALKQFEKENPHLFKEIISDYKGWDSPVVQTYAVRWIPTCFLISKEGKIIKVTHSLKELF